jgi:hypothetical protein
MHLAPPPLTPTTTTHYNLPHQVMMRLAELLQGEDSTMSGIKQVLVSEFGAKVINKYSADVCRAIVTEIKQRRRPNVSAHPHSLTHSYHTHSHPRSPHSHSLLPNVSAHPHPLHSHSLVPHPLTLTLTASTPSHSLVPHSLTTPTHSKLTHTTTATATITTTLPGETRAARKGPAEPRARPRVEAVRAAGGPRYP